MPGFILKDEVEELTYDFEPFIKAEDGGKGQIPEPSAAQIQQFRTTVAQMLSEMLPDADTNPDTQDPVQMRKMVLEVIGRDQTEIQQKLLHTIAEVCSGKPSFDVLNELPYRHQQAFSGWITGEFLLPNAPTPATTN